MSGFKALQKGEKQYKQEPGANWIIPNEHTDFGNSIGFIHLNYLDDKHVNHGGVLLIWKRHDYYEFKENGEKFKSKTYDGIITLAKRFLLNLHDPFTMLMQDISDNINNSVSEMSHKMDLRIVEFRGFLFSQTIQLK